MYKSLNKFLLIISSIIITVVLAACGTKSQNESQSESQSKLSSSKEVLEKYSEVVNNIKSFKYSTVFTVKSTVKNSATGEIETLDRIREVTSEEGSFSTEPFAILSNRISEFSNYTIKRIKYEYRENFVKPSFEIYENSIRITLPIIETVPSNLVNGEVKVFEILKKREKLSRKEIEELSGYNKSKVIRSINGLIEKSIVEQLGKGRSVKYQLKK